MTRKEAIEECEGRVADPRILVALRRADYDPLFVELTLGVPAFWPGGREVQEDDFAYTAVYGSWRLNGCPQGKRDG